MDEKEYLARTVNRQLEAGRPLVLLSILNLQGSTPRHGGTKMVVGADGQSYGTIGGSLIEAAAIREAKNVLAAKKPRIMSYELSGKDATSPDMICGGQAEIILDYLVASPENREFARQWYDMIRQGKELYFLTHLQGNGESFRVLGHGILDTEGNIPGGTSLTAADIAKLKPELHNVTRTAVLPLGETRVVVDRMRRLKTLYCFGAGHVAVPTAHLAALVGFRVVVIDDRPEYANAERFPKADKILVIKDFNRACDGLEIDADSYIVIVTRGHQYDRAVLEQSLGINAGYIGMISSRRKRQAIYEYLMSKGFKKERLAQVHSPIGINIGGETPEEIAVSIVAELIQVRSGQAT
jgi:xanthine dehydrogenase accessory factor